MKKNLALLLLLGILHVPFLAQAQTTTYTPQLHLALPPAAPGTWGEQYNNNFSTLDSAVTGTFGTAIAFSGDITPAQITADQTDYNPTGLSTANVLRLSSDAARSINSLAGGSDGRTIILYNVGSQEITLKNNSGIGSAANQFLLNADVVLGINQGAIVQYDSTSLRWRVASSIGSTGAGAAHVIQDETSNLTARPTLNFAGAGVTCTDNSGSNRTDCTVPGGSTDVAAAYTWTGAHSWRDGNFSLLNTGDTSKILKFDLSGFTASTTRTWSGPNASTRLLGDSDFSATGLMARTGSGTYAGRTLTAGVANEFIITNPAGIAGDPTIALGSLAVKTNQSNSFSTGDQNLTNASSFTFPSSPGAAPTTNGRCAYDTAAHRLRCAFNGATVTLATVAETQPLSSILSSLAALGAANNVVPIFTSATGITGGVLPSCLDSAGQHLNYDNSLHIWSCGTSSTGGLTGGTIGKFLLATAANAFDATTGNLSQSAGVINASGGFTIGDVSTNKLTIDPSAVTGTKTLTAQNTSGLVIPCDTVIANYTDAHILKVVKVGSIVTCADGGTAGTGTWTDASASTGTNKTIDVEATGNVITTVSKIWLPAAGGTAAAPGLLWDALASNAPTAACSAGSTETTMLRCTADFPDLDGEYSLQQTLKLPSDWTGNIDALIKYRTVTANAALNTVWQIKTACRADAEVDDVAWNTANTVTDAGKATTLQLNDAAITTLTTTGCAAGELLHLMIMRQRTHASDTMTGTISLVGVEVTLRRAQ